MCLELRRESGIRLEEEKTAGFGGAWEARVSSEFLLVSVKHHQSILRR